MKTSKVNTKKRSLDTFQNRAVSPNDKSLMNSSITKNKGSQKSHFNSVLKPSPNSHL